MISEWLQTPLGRSLLSAERSLLAPVLEGAFGEFGVQVGVWGDSEQFAPLLRTQRRGILASGSAVALRPGIIGLPERLPLASDSVDVLLLAHTLDFCAQPHATLREAARVLRSDGQIVVLGFKPGGLWGLKRLLPGRMFPPGAQRLVAPRELADWLELLDMRIVERQRFFFRFPRVRADQPVSEVWEERGERFWPELAACYMLRAQKRLHTLTPVRQFWKPATKVVGSLVKPTASVGGGGRTSRVVVPFDPVSGRRR